MVGGWIRLPDRKPYKGTWYSPLPEVQIEYRHYPYFRTVTIDYVSGHKVLSLQSVMIQAEVLERAEGIKREYNELDTVWFMAGSLFQVSCFHLDNYLILISWLENSTFVFSFKIFNSLSNLESVTFFSNIHMIFPQRLSLSRFSNKLLLLYNPVWCICRFALC